MAKMTIRGLEDKIAELEELSIQAPEIIRRTLYEGAGVVADNMRQAIQGIPTDNRIGTPENPVYGIQPLQKQGLEASIRVASAATSTEEIWNGIGDPVYPPAKAELARHGISCEGKRARQVTKADYAEYDYLIGMGSANIRNMLRIFGGDPDGKVARLLSYAGSERDISDPWYTGEFGTTYNDVLEGCTAFLQYLQQNGRIDT